MVVNLDPKLEAALKEQANRKGVAPEELALNIPERFANPSVGQNVAVGVRLLDSLDEIIGDVELYLDRTVQVDDVQTEWSVASGQWLVIHDGPLIRRQD